jgi:hypothetical protein
MQLELHRDYREPTCTLGVLSVFGRRWQTIEAGNPIDPALYRLVPHSSEAHRDVWALVAPAHGVYHMESDVPVQQRGKVRTTVLLHAANYASELLGIAPGKERRKQPNGVWAVYRSRDALNEVRNAIGGAFDLWINITEAPGL